MHYIYVFMLSYKFDVYNIKYYNLELITFNCTYSIIYIYINFYIQMNLLFY